MYCEYDLFGIDVSHYQLAPAVDMPNDAERIKRIKTLVDAGYGDKVLIAHDIHTKERLVSLLLVKFFFISVGYYQRPYIRETMHSYTMPM